MEEKETEELCAYCKATLDPFGQLHAFIKLEGRYRQFCIGECHGKYLKKIGERE